MDVSHSSANPASVRTSCDFHQKENKNRKSTYSGMTQKSISDAMGWGDLFCSTVSPSCVPSTCWSLCLSPSPLPSLLVPLPIPFLLPPLPQSCCFPDHRALLRHYGIILLPTPGLTPNFSLFLPFDLVVSTPTSPRICPLYGLSFSHASAEQRCAIGACLRPLAAPICLGPVGWII